MSTHIIRNLKAMLTNANRAQRQLANHPEELYAHLAAAKHSTEIALQVAQQMPRRAWRRKGQKA